MKLNKNLGMLLLSIWLILIAVMALFNVDFRGASYVRGVLALAAGVVILLFDKAPTGS